MKKILSIALAFALVSAPAFAQSSPNLQYGQVPTAAQWNSYFAAKQDVLGFSPLNKAGDRMTGPLGTVASSASSAGLNLPPGTAPSAPINGDLWLTSAGLYARINGSNVGPFTTTASAIYAGSTAPSPPATFQLWIDTSANPAILKQYDGAQWASIGSLNSSTHVWTALGTWGGATIGAAFLPNPGPATLGGVRSLAAVSHNFLTSIGTNGQPTQAQPACADLSDASTGCAATLAAIATSGSASDLITGTASGARGGTGVSNSGKTITLGGNLTTAGAFNTTITVTADSNATFPAGSHAIAPLDSPNFSGTVTTTGNLAIGAGAAFSWTGRSTVLSLSDGLIALRNNAGTDSSNLVFGSNTSSFVGLFPSGTTLRVLLGDATGYAPMQMASAQMGTPTGGSQGAGTINVSGGFYVNGVAIPTSTAVSSVFGRTGAVVAATNDYAITQISGLGTGVATALGANTGSAGAPVLFNGAGGTPSSLTLTNATGLPNAGLVNSATTVNGQTCTLGSTCTVAAAAGTLTGATLASGVTASSLTSAAGGSFGTAAFVATGTSGGTVPLLNAANTWSATQTISGAQRLLVGGSAGSGQVAVQAVSLPSITWYKTSVVEYNSYVNAGNQWVLDTGGANGVSLNVGGGPYFAAKTTGTISLGDPTLLWTNVYASAYTVGATAGVSCSGVPTVSFASVNGIVTHC